MRSTSARGEVEPPRAVAPFERRADPRPGDLLREHDLAVEAVGIGHGELDRVLPDAGRAQRFFLGRFCRARILYSRNALLSQ